MKKLIKSLIILLLLSNLINYVIAQEQQSTPVLPIDKETGLITYQEVVNQEGTADKLYIRGIEWLNSFYKNPAAVCRILNRESCIIEGDHNFNISYTNKNGVKINAGKILYSFKLEFKNNRYRYTITNLTLKQASRFPIEKWLNKNDRAYNERWDLYLNQVDEFAKKFIQSLKKEMQPKIIKKDEW